MRYQTQPIFQGWSLGIASLLLMTVTSNAWSQKFVDKNLQYSLTLPPGFSIANPGLLDSAKGMRLFSALDDSEIFIAIEGEDAKYRQHWPSCGNNKRYSK